MILDILPIELILKIASYLDDKSLKKFSLLCKKSANIIRENKEYLISLIRSSVKKLTIDSYVKNSIKLDILKEIKPVFFIYDAKSVFIRNKVYPIGKGKIYGCTNDLLFCIEFNTRLLKTRLYPVLIESSIVSHHIRNIPIWVKYQGTLKMNRDELKDLVSKNYNTDKISNLRIHRNRIEFVQKFVQNIGIRITIKKKGEYNLLWIIFQKIVYKNIINEKIWIFL